MQIAVLGPLEVRDDAGAQVTISGSRLSALLTRLAVDAGRAVRVDALVDAVWGAAPPAEPLNALQTLVSRLRRLLGADRLVQSTGGYRLVVDALDVDVNRFESLAAAGADALRRGSADDAARQLRDALALCRGPFDGGDPSAADRTDTALSAYAARTARARRAALADRIEADVRIGDPARADALVAELEALIDDEPLDERAAGQLVRVLAARGRQADALRAYERLRSLLADELGVDPSPELQQLHLALLRGELAGPPAGATRRPRRTNLKAQLTSFVGRDSEVARIVKTLEENRLVTLVGPGGAGKTRLACESAAQVLDSAPDGVWLVELAPLGSGDDVEQAVLGALGLRDAHLLEPRGRLAARDVLTRLIDALADKRAVLVFDNCEHVVDACARLADQLLAHCAQLRVLATSREPLGIVGEVLLSVPPLGQPAAAAAPGDAIDYPAVRLFADRAADVRPGFAVDSSTVATVIEIVRRLDGLPLAIELAAARLRTMPLGDIAARLSDRFRLLTGGSRTALPRHRTLRAVVGWSWDLLAPDERRLVEQLAVFPSVVTTASATAVTDLNPSDVADLLASLIDKSLLQPLGNGRRLRMLETIREYGVERLAERGELAEIRARHADHFAAVLAEAEPHLTQHDQLAWFELLVDERDNLLAALRYRCDVGDATGAVTMATSLTLHAMMLGAPAEQSHWLADALAVPGEVAPAVRIVARALQALDVTAAGHPVGDVEASNRDSAGDSAGDNTEVLRRLVTEFVAIEVPAASFAALLAPAVAFFAGEPDLCDRFIQRVVEAGDSWGAAAARMFRALMAENAGDIETMRSETETALSAFRRLGERWGTASALRSLGQLRLLGGDPAGALAAYEEALALCAQLQSVDDQGFVLGRLAEIALRLDDPQRARGYVDRMLEGADVNGSAAELAYATAMAGAVENRLGNRAAGADLQQQALARIEAMPQGHPALGHVRAIVYALAARTAFETADPAAAETHGRAAYTAAVATQDAPVIAAVGVLLADVVAARGEPAAAAQMLGAATRLRGSDDPTSTEIRALTTRLRTDLGADHFGRAYARGQALDREAAIESLALRPVTTPACGTRAS